MGNSKSEARHGKINATLGNLSRSGIEILEDGKRIQVADF
jgi:hypothetical protein